MILIAGASAFLLTAYRAQCDQLHNIKLDTCNGANMSCGHGGLLKSQRPTILRLQANDNYIKVDARKERDARICALMRSEPLVARVESGCR
jgi:hypothetical protein